MLKNRQNQFWSVLKKFYLFSLLFLIPGIAFNFFTATPTIAAEKITLSWGLLKFSLSVKSLETFARSGKVEPELNFFLTKIKPEQKQKIQNFLQAKYEVKPVTVARLAYTSVGTKLLQNLGEIIQTPQKENGFYSLRSAVILAAANPEGITPIALLNHLPTDIEINLVKLIKLAKQVNHLLQQTEQFVAHLDETNIREDAHQTNQIYQLKKAGKFKVEQQTIYLEDRQRNRSITLDLYLPKLTSTSIPVIIISNGLGARRDRFEELAQHLTSYGFAVIIPDHPGSDRERQLAFFQGLYRENFDAAEFINRPLDISFILDQLERSNQFQFNHLLNLKQVGIFGYSFGGATALSLAGAEINFEQLTKNCSSSTNLLNISLLYQCRALELSRKQVSLRDKRVKAVYLFVPFSNSLFGKAQMKQINIPVLWEASDQDIITPLLLEQLPSFSKLKTTNQYLVIATGMPHTYITRSKQQDKSAIKIRKVAEAYHRALSLIFFKTHLTNEEKYQHFLSPEFIHAIGENPYNLHLVDFK
ncbi:protein of unknown function DUF1400 [Stanieria cyanosphaera PCC 7437]|uniref:DUF1400 domain-containing protein n=1 Tax=Stanieria cyanosphaera (strain ATCC 29371 / PCC 7437) TaxID=111780 RepID=K9XZ15_STAC7|nr:alpha/beta hydrolase [Stanieria cyanosphaera]AFZ36912.1 protein of unknown function DUF1400 [Stanieria cyanosphaera PCC 7437]